MKGLLYKDIVLNKTNIGAMVIILAYLVIELITAYFIPESEDFVFFVNGIMFGGIIAIQGGFPGIAMVVGRMDAGTKWIQYALALPGGYRYMISERYMLGLIGNGIALVLNFILVGIVKLGFDIDIKIPIMLILLIFGIMTVIQAFVLLLFSRGKTGIVGKVFAILLLLLFLGVLCYLAFGDISALTGKHLFRRMAMWLFIHEKRIWCVLAGLIFAGAVLKYLSYRLAVYLYKRD